MSESAIKKQVEVYRSKKQNARRVEVVSIQTFGTRAAAMQYVEHQLEMGLTASYKRVPLDRGRIGYPHEVKIMRLM